MIAAPAKYQGIQAKVDLVYEALCKVITEQQEAVDWGAFGAAEWALLSEMARLEGVGPLLYWKYKKDRWPPGMPSSCCASLKHSYYNTLAQNMLLFQELDRILDAFDKAAIPTLLLKGAALAGTIYDDIGLRPMGDLDLLVHKADLDRAAALVAQLGINQAVPELWHGINEKENQFQNALLNSRNLMVELHWNLVAGDGDYVQPPDGWAWSLAAPMQPRGQTGPHSLSLNLTGSLLYLSAHIALQHGLAASRLIWLLDLHLLLQGAGEAVDWDELVDQSRVVGWSYALWATLDNIRRLFGTSIPPETMTALHQDGEGDAALVRSRAIYKIRSERVFDKLTSLPWPQKIKLFLAYVLPIPARMRFRYRPNPSWLWPLYYPYRWWDIARDVLRSLRRKFSN